MKELSDKLTDLDWDFYNNFKFTDNQVLKFNLTDINTNRLTCQPLIDFLIKYFKITRYTEIGTGAGTNFFTTCKYIEFAQLPCSAQGFGLYNVPHQLINELKNEDLLISNNLKKDNVYPFAEISDLSLQEDISQCIDKTKPGLIVFNQISGLQIEDIRRCYHAAADNSVLFISKTFFDKGPVLLAENSEGDMPVYMDTKYAVIIFKNFDKNMVDSFLGDFANIFAKPLDFFGRFLQEKARRIQTDRRNNDIFNLNLVRPHKEKYFFSVVGLFKNESMALKEWIEHYLRFGADHFYLVDNNSTDNYREILQPYIDRRLVTLYFCEEDKYQSGMLRELTNILKNQTQWVGVFDLDEFVYPTRLDSIPDVIRKFDAYDAVVIPWLLFGSNGHTKQPGSIVQSFTKRKKYEGDESHTKSIVRSSAVNILTQHVPWTKDNNHVRSDGKPVTRLQSRIKIDDDNILKIELANKNLVLQTFKLFNRPTRLNLYEKDIPQMELLNNHYAVQSLEYFEKVKVGRLEVSENCTTVKKMDTFNILDRMANEIIDETLALKTGLRPMR